MRRVALLGLLGVACVPPTHSPCGARCDKDHLCPSPFSCSDPNGGVCQDSSPGGSCGADGGVLAFPYAPSNFNPGQYSPAVAVSLACDAGIATDTLTFAPWCSHPPQAFVQSQDGGSEIVIVPVTSFTLGSGFTLSVTGSRPLVLAIYGDGLVAGTVNAGGSGTTGGPGSLDAGDCGTTGGQDNPAQNGGGGGGGGSFGTLGADGGFGGLNPGQAPGGNPGPVAGSASLIPLRGGCQGGPGGAGSGSFAVAGGGGGGGAIQLSAAGTLTLTGTMTAPGGGGAGGSKAGPLGEGPSGFGGGGGGSGGAIFLEAVVIVIDGGHLTANGGGGGRGAPGGGYYQDGTPGEDGHTDDVIPAAGGAFVNFAIPGGDGGSGATATVAATSGWDGDLCAPPADCPVDGGIQGGGGGAGGGLGRIRIRAIGACPIANPLFSPSSIQQTCQ